MVFSHIFPLLSNFSLFSLLYAEWVTPRRFLSRVNQAETPIHQTGMCVLSLLIGPIQRGEKTTSRWVILAVFGLLSRRSCHPGPPRISNPGAWGRGGGGGGGSRIPAGLTQGPLMEPGVARPRTQQHNLKMPLEGLILRLLLFSSVILRLMSTDNTSLSRCLFQHPPAPFF